MKKLISMRYTPIILLALLAVLAAACGTAPADTSEEDPVLVGVNLALTGPGAINSVNILNGIKLAAEEVNAAGGVLGGRRIKLIVEDNKCIPSLKV